MANAETLIALRQYFKGKINKWDLEDVDPLIYNVNEKQNKGESILTIRFDDEEKFLRALGLNDDDAWFIRAATSPYQSYDFYEYYTIKEDFMEGYGVWSYFNDENIELLEKISKLIYPKHFDMDDYDFKHEFAKKLITLYSRQIDEILSDFTHEKNNELSVTLKDVIYDDFKSAFSIFGMKLLPYDGFTITVGELVYLFIRYNVPHLSIKGLIKTMFKDENLGGWYDSYYEYSNDKNFDDDSFNKTANNELNKIWDKLSEEFDNEEGRKFFEMIDRLSKKYKLSSWYDLPKNRKFKFKIDDFDKESYKIVVELLKPDGEVKRINLTEENFNYLLFQPELFNLEDI